VRYTVEQDEYRRWAVRDNAQPFRYLFLSRHATEDSAQAFCDIMNSTGTGVRRMDQLWAVYDRVREYAVPL
jgi:hypothetical protein